MTVDWSEFRDGDRVRVTFEGVWRTSDAVAAEYCYLATGGRYMHVRDALYPATSAELIERPFTPPAAGKLFRSGSGALHISAGDAGYRTIRTPNGKPAHSDIHHLYSDEFRPFLDSIEVLDL